jgi:hypothetical protein
MNAENPSNRKNPLSVTIGNDFGKPATTGAPLTPQNAEARIVRLTSNAQNYLKRGQSALAFDTLMEAYLLDPVHPLVISCEKAVLPAWETFRKQQIMSGAAPPATDDERLARLKAEKDTQRREKERQIWDQASQAPRLFTNKAAPPQGKRDKNTLL